MDRVQLKEGVFQQIQVALKKPAVRATIYACFTVLILHTSADGIQAQNTKNRVRSNGSNSSGTRRDSQVRQAAQNSPVDQSLSPSEDGLAPTVTIPLDVDQMLSPKGMTSTLKLLLLMTVLSLAPSILIMTTCFIRFVIVMGLLRQALGTQQLPPNQVLIGLCLFLTMMVMAPVWQESYDNGIRPYTSPENGSQSISLETAFQRTVSPIRDFMSKQIARAENGDAIMMFLEFHRPAPGTEAAKNYLEPSDYNEVPLTVLLPAYIMSELKTSFLIGFQIYLPFLIIDMVISSILISMGMMMLPPVLISLPFKLLLFVMIDGWYLIVGMLMESVQMIPG
jgi:flagellar biosynthesis protein FliP